MLTSILFVIAGLALLTLAGDKLVSGAAGIAARYKVSPVFIGIVIIGFGTSLPEMLATTQAARMGESALALGNIIGSNIANIGLILGLGLLMAKTATMPQNRKDYLLMLVILIGFSILATTMNGINAMWGGLLLLVLAGYLGLSLYLGKNVAIEEDVDTHAPVWKLAIYTCLGLVGLAVGADFLVTGATDIATQLGISPRIIGITMVAIGTSLPELAATIAAVRQNKLGLTMGNILGSNVFNILGAAAFSALFAPLPLTGFEQDMLWMPLFSLCAFPLFLGKSFIPMRILGAFLLGLYGVYLYTAIL